MASGDWWFDGDSVFFGDYVLGSHEKRLAELRSRRIKDASSAGKFIYEKLFPAGRICGTPYLLLILEYKTDEVFPDIDKDVKSTFTDWNPTVSYIGDNAIQSDMLRAMILPQSVDRVYDLAFAGCPKLRYIIVPDECEFSFQQRAFIGCDENLTFSVVSGSPVISALKRFGYRVEERPANTMEACVRRIAEKTAEEAQKSRIIRAADESDAYCNLLPNYTVRP